MQPTRNSRLRAILDRVQLPNSFLIWELVNHCFFQVDKYSCNRLPVYFTSLTGIVPITTAVTVCRAVGRTKGNDEARRVLMRSVTATRRQQVGFVSIRRGCACGVRAS